MLVLSRQKDESIMIGENVEVIVIDISNKNIRLGISAPRTIPVHRKEIYEAIKSQKIRSGEMVLIHS